VTGSLAAALQESDTTALASFGYISGATFTAIGTAQTLGSNEVIRFKPSKRYVRAVATVADTGSYTAGVFITPEKRITNS
jgi:hypothetical protein